MSNFFYLLIAFFLLFLNAFFVAAEFGLVKLRHTQVNRLAELHGFRGKILQTTHAHLDAYLSACQLGITLASLGLGWVGEPVFAVLLDPLFRLLDINSQELIKIFSFTTAFLILSFLHIVVGELMPKSIAIRQPESISLWTAVPLYGFYWLMYPAIWFLNACSNYILKITKLDAKHHDELFYSTEEIKLILTASHLHGELTQEETRIIEHTLDFADLEVTEIMRSRQEMVALDIQKPIYELLEIITEHRYTRYPVYSHNVENMIGIIHIKDLFSFLYQHKKIKDLKSFIRPILKVSPDLPTLALLKKFRTGSPHFALVYSGEHGLLGFVTLDNLLQVMIGRIKDEFHKTKVDWKENKDGSFSVKGDCSIYSLETALGLTIEIGDKKINTLTGLIFDKLGAFPNIGEHIKFEGFDAVIEKQRGAKIEVVRIYPKNYD